MPSRFALQSLENDRAFAERQLADSPSGGWGTVRIMWENRLREIDDEVASLTVSAPTTASVALVFEGRPVTGEVQIRADFAMDAVGAFQRIVSAKLASNRGANLGSRGKVRSSNESKLYIRDLVRGSVGFLLEEQPGEQSDMLPTPLKTAVEGTTALIETLAVANQEEFDTSVTTIQPRVLSAVKSFAKVLSSAGATAEISSDQHHAELSLSAVSLLSDRLAQIEIRETVTDLPGTLLGVFPDRHEFEFQQQGVEETIHGAVTDTVAQLYQEDPTTMLLQPVVVTIRTIETLRHGTRFGEQKVLEAVRASPDTAET